MHGGTRWSFRDNHVHGMPATAGEPVTSVRIDCTLASGPCRVTGNTIVGSDRAQRARHLLDARSPAASSASTRRCWATTCRAAVATASRCADPAASRANDNVLVRCHGQRGRQQLAQLGLDRQPARDLRARGRRRDVDPRHDRQPGDRRQPVRVQPAHQRRRRCTRSPRRTAHLAGLYLDANYAAQGVLASTPRARCTGGTCGGELCDDDGGCGACGGRCGGFGVFDHDHIANLIVTGEIRIESATNVIVQGNVVIGTAGKGAVEPDPLHQPARGRAERRHRRRRQPARQARRRRRATSPASSSTTPAAAASPASRITGNTLRAGSGAGARQRSAGRHPPHPAARRVARGADRGQQLRQRPASRWSASRPRRCAPRRGSPATSASTRTTRAPAPRDPHRARAHATSHAPGARRRPPRPALGLALDAGKTYALDGHLRFRAADARTGLATALGAPAGSAVSVVAACRARRRAGPAAGGADGAPARLPLAVRRQRGVALRDGDHRHQRRTARAALGAG